MQLKKSSQKILDYLNQNNAQTKILQFQETTKTSQDAANQIKCQVAQIAKSLVFQIKNSDELILIIASGSNRVNTKKVEKIINAKITRADPTYIKQETGFTIGGIPPFAHNKKLKTLLDKDLKNYNKVYAAAGTPHSIFSLTPEELHKTTKATFYDIAE